MKSYKCKYIDEDGEEKQNIFFDLNENGLKKQLSDKNHLIIDFKIIDKKIDSKENKKRYIDFINDFSFLLESNLMLVDITELLKKKYENKKEYFNFYVFLSKELKKGELLSFALLNQSFVKIQEEDLELIKVGERNKYFKEIFKELREKKEEENYLLKELKSMLIYPSILIFVALIVLSTILFFVVPQMSEVYADNNQKLPLITTIVILISDFFINNYLIIISFIFVFIYLMIFFLKKKEIKYKIDRFLLKNSFTADLIQKVEYLKFLLVFNSLISSKNTIVNSIHYSNKIVSNLYLKELLNKVELNIKSGNKISKSFIDIYEKNNVEINKDFSDILFVSENNSDFEKYFKMLRKKIKEDLKEKKRFFLSLFEPLIIIILAIIIGFVTIAMLLPIFSFNIN